MNQTIAAGFFFSPKQNKELTGGVKKKKRAGSSERDKD